MKVCALEQEVKNLTSKKAIEVLHETIKLYEETAKYAREQGCRILVFPEMGLMSGISPQDRFNVAETLPSIGSAPDPNSQPTLHALATLAKENELHLVASTIEKADNFYNTTVVFTPEGKLAGRHRKMHLYLEPCLTPSLETPRTIQLDGIGQVQFITCFDLYFSEANSGVPCDLAILVTHWYDEVPNLTLLSVARAWSISNQAPIIVCNARFTRQATLGAAMFHPNGNGQYSMSFSKDKECLHVFDLDIREKLIRDPKDVTIPDVYQPIMGDLTRFEKVPLIETTGILKLDVPTISCQIMYELLRPCQDIMYMMLAADGARRFGNGDRLYLQELYVIAINKTTRQISFLSGSPFRSLRMSMGIKDETNSSTVFPLVVSDNFSLVPPSNWTFDKSLLEVNVNGPIVCAGLCRRVFSRDVPVPSRKRSRTM